MLTVRENRVERFEEVRGGHVELGEGRRAQAREIFRPIDAGSERGKLFDGHLVVGLLGIAARHAIQRSFR